MEDGYGMHASVSCGNECNDGCQKEQRKWQAGTYVCLSVFMCVLTDRRPTGRVSECECLGTGGTFD